jgi:hypothetical protein
MKVFLIKIHVPTIAVTTFAELAGSVTGMAVDEANVAEVTCRATLDEETSGATGTDAAMLGTVATTLATVGGATMAE